MKISASLIIKNEEEMLPLCLESIKGVDEIIMVDTGSEDKSIEIAESFGAKVYTDYKWKDHFSEARNESKKHCTGDWLLIIDGDEILQSSIKSIRKLLDEPFMKHKDLVMFDVDTGMETNTQPRLFRNRPDVEWVGAAHNKVFVRYPNGEMKELVHEDGLVYFSNLKIQANFSPNHRKDPDRTLRIMLAEIGKGPQVLGQAQYTRYLYYVGREWLNRKDPIKCLYFLDEYTKMAPPTNEMADAWFLKATCYQALNRWEPAIDAVLQVIKFLPEYKAAWAMMHNMAAPETKKKWEKMFRMANNKNVLFVRKDAEKLFKENIKK